MTEIKDRIDNLKMDYINSVLPLIFKNTKLENLHNYSCELFENKFEIKLDIKTLLNFAPEYEPTGNKFLHFTNLKALNSILNESTLRLYNLNNMNDPKEFEYLANKFNFEGNQLENFKKQTYAFSMCPIDVLESDDALSLWRFYGQGGLGCAIEIEFLNNLENSYTVKLGKINYTLPNYEEFFEANKEFENRNKVEMNIKALVEIIGCLHKNPIYRIEQEIRLFHENGYADFTKIQEENSLYGYDINANGEIVIYRKVDLFNIEFGEPLITIKKIHLGFKHSIQYKQKISDLIRNIYLGKMIKYKRVIEIPEVCISNLTGLYN